MSDTEILDKEESAKNDTPTSADQGELDSLATPEEDDGFYRNEGGGGKKRFRMTRKKGLIGGGLIGGSIAGAIIFSIVQGPFQFIHMSQLLQRFHFASVEDNSNSRLLKMYKWTKNAKNDTRQNTNLGRLGNRIAGNIDTKLADIGIEKIYAQGVLTGTYDGMTLDPVKFSEKAQNGGDFKGLDEEAFISKFKEQYGVELSRVDGERNLFKIPAEEGLTAYFKNRALNKLIVKETGTDGVSGSIAARIMGKRDATTWHPIRRLDAKIVGSADQKLAAWLAELKSRIKNGAEDPSVTASGEKTKDANGNPVDNPQNEQAAADVEDTAKAAREAADAAEGDTKGLISKFTESTGGKGAIAGTAIIGLLCGAKALADSADKVKHDMVVLPLTRIGMQAISLGNQAMNGGDLDITQLGYFSQELSDPNTGASWAGAKSIQAELGQEQTGPDIPDEANIAKIQDGTVFSQVLNSLPGLDITCSVLDSTIGQIFNFAISLTTPITTILTMAVTSTGQFQDAIASVVRWMAGSPIPTLVFGPTFGNYANYGARLGANDSKTALGGIQLTNRQSADLKENRLIGQRQELAQESFTKRFFDPYSPDSLVSQAIDRTPNVTTNTASIFSSLINPMKSLVSLISSMVPKAKAETTSYNYGFPEVGFSLDDLNSSKYDDPYTNSEAAVATLNIPCEINGKPNHPCGADYIALAQKCFGVTLSPDINTPINSGLHNTVDVLNKDYDKPNAYGMHCNETDTTWTQIRFYILDSKTAESTDCYFSDTPESCRAVGF